MWKIVYGLICMFSCLLIIGIKVASGKPYYETYLYRKLFFMLSFLLANLDELKTPVLDELWTYLNI